MAKSKYVDMTSIIQVIGAIYNNPNLLDANDRYFFNEEDFVDDFHKTVFGSIYNLHQLGTKVITLEVINDYLKERPKSLATYNAFKGNDFLIKCSELVKEDAFNYYYNRLKKMTLFRAYERAGIDLSWLYNPDEIMDLKKKQKQEDWFDNTPLEKIADIIDDKLLDIRMTYVDDVTAGGTQAGDGIFELIESLKETPEIGYPLYGKYTNAVTRGARLKKFYLRSAATGVGKSRSMIADACSIGCSQIYDLEQNLWVTTGKAEPTIYIATEQDLGEIQTMMLAFLSGVDEEHILTGTYFTGEWERVAKAAQLIKQSPLYVEQLPDFSLLDIENTIKRGIREHDAKYVVLDYLHTSMKILEEITKRSGGVRLREDNILFMMSIRLKDLCNQYGIFILSATQLNADYQDAETPDQNLLRGAKSIADKIDLGMIMLEVTQKDRESLDTLIKKNGFEMPTIKISVYKNRRGRWKGIYLWCKANRGICRIDPMFVTKWNYELEEIEDFKIHIEEESAF